MATPQKKIDSGFDRESTADDVLADVDLTGKLALVTGGHSGLGLETTRALAKAGAHVIVLARNVEAAKQATSGIDNVDFGELDLARLHSVGKFAAEFLTSGRSVDILINGAGVMACPENRTEQGWEFQFAVNHVGHYALVNGLWPALADGGARVVSVSSAGHHVSDVRWDDLEFRHGYDKWAAYGQSKTANALFAVQLDELGKANGVRAFSLHPGAIATRLQRHLEIEEMRQLGWVDEDGNPTLPSIKTPQQGAATSVWAATAVRLDGLGGAYCEDCDIAEPATEPMVGVCDHAVDPEAAARLWAVSAQLTGLDVLHSV